MGIILDVIIVAIVVLNIFICYKKGLVKLAVGISMPASFKKPPSMPICPNSFSIRTTFSPEIASFKSCLINVVFPAPRKPEIISIFVILLTFFSVQMCTDCKSLSARYLASRQCIALHRPNLPKFRSATYYFTQIPSKVKHRQNPVTGRV